MTITYLAAMMDAETGGNTNYEFEGADDLFSKPADDIVGAFIGSLRDEAGRPKPLEYELNSAIKKRQKQVVMASGSLIFGNGDIPFLVMISPAIRTGGAQ
jgi:hypothetical protein